MITMAFQPHSFMFQPHEEDHPHHHHHHHHHDHDHHNNIASNPNPLFHGSGPHAPAFMMMKRSVSFDHHQDHHDQQGVSMQQHGSAAEDELSDDGSQIGERKKRLNLEQVKTLEKSFEMGNKLEPERKLQLAKALGLQPRQVAIWFQNRRARWKTKQLEKDFDVLRKQFDALKADNDSLHAQNKKLHAELTALKGRDYSNEAGGRRENHKKDHQGDQGSWSNGSDQNSSDINLDISRTPINNVNNKNNNTSTSSPSSHQLAVHGKNLFPSSLIRPSSITQLLQGNSRPSDHLQCLKVDHPHHQMIQSDETFCNMFVNGSAAAAAAAVEADQPQTAGFWQWPEQHYFH